MLGSRMEPNKHSSLVEPVVLSDVNKYSRLFDEFEYLRPKDQLFEQLTGLGLSMFDERTKMPAAAVQAGTAFSAGYTYFGQFIAHDLTFDDTAFRDAGTMPPEQTRNYRTPWLDLDSVYGDGPGSNRHGGLYASDGMSFLLGEATNSQGVRFDVPLHHDRPMVADCRNCENAILRQLHAIFLRLHNIAVENLPQEMPSEDRFQAARQRVRWQYQWLVRERFLGQVCTPAIFDSVRKGDLRIRYPEGRFSIPVEFSHAAGRFGHSMVRRTYQLRNGGPDVPLLRLFATAHGRGSLPADVWVDWSFFFSSEPVTRIDRLLTNPLQSLDDASINAFVNSPIPHEPRALPVRTLCRGAAAKLATGQQVRDKLDPQARIMPPDCDYEIDPWDLLDSFELAEETPLWYYLLLEAELNEAGLRLGAVGSRLVAEIIETSLQQDPDSFLNQDDYQEDWTPLAWPNGTEVAYPGQLAAAAGF